MAAVMEEKAMLGLREVALLAFSAFALFMLIALITFNNEDAGWSHSGSLQNTSNSCGIIGAWLADFILSLFGLMGYLFPVMLAWIGYLFYRDQLHTENAFTTSMRYLGFIVTLFFGAALIYLHILRVDIDLPGGSGGAIGQEIGDIALVMLGSSGTNLVLLVGLLAGITLFTDLSWLFLIDLIGKYTIKFCLFLWSMRNRITQLNFPQHPAGGLEYDEIGKNARQREKQNFTAPVARGKVNIARPQSHDSGYDPLFASDEEFRAKTSKHSPEAFDLHEEVEIVRHQLNSESGQRNQRQVHAAPGTRRETKSQHTSLDDEDEPAAAQIIPFKQHKAKGQTNLKVTDYTPRNTQPSAAVLRYMQESNDTLPGLALLDNRDTRVVGYSNTELQEMSRLVEDVLQDFNVVVEVVAVNPGPVITRFELQPAAGVKASRISGLAKDLARALSVTAVRVIEIIPGKTVMGLEIPNQQREMVTLRELLASTQFSHAKSYLSLAMGKDIAGQPVVADLAKMPHVLVAGTTGSGKSVAINTMILSILYKATPEQVRMIMIDPKMLELSVYEGIPHLLTPVVTDMKEAQNALRWAVGEMERRYKLMSKMGVRNLAGFNQLIQGATERGEAIRDPLFVYDSPLGDEQDFPVLSTLPSIVIVIDELADMMMIVGKKVEELIARLAQKARAAGIHLILATQRPSVDVLTGLIKANVPTRISFQVSSRIDSRTILDQGGAESLLGNGDMLFLPSGTSIPIRAHGAFVDDHEVHQVVEFLKQTAPPNYLEEITQEVLENDSNDSYNGSNDDSSDALYEQAVQFVTESRKASISSVQRRFKVGYNRAARMIEDMEMAGIVSPPETNGSREVLVPAPPKG